jgi:hypothetical protein
MIFDPDDHSTCALCAFVLALGHYIIADVGYNWYLRNIHILSLSKKGAVRLSM